MRLRNFILFILIAAVFISGNGVVLAVHTCLASSTKTVSVFENNCCKDVHSNPCHNDDGAHLEDKCCISQFSYYKLNLPGNTKKSELVDLTPIVIQSFSIRNERPGITYYPEKSIDYSFDIPLLNSQLLI